MVSLGILQMACKGRSKIAAGVGLKSRPKALKQDGHFCIAERSLRHLLVALSAHSLHHTANPSLCLWCL